MRTGLFQGLLLSSKTVFEHGLGLILGFGQSDSGQPVLARLDGLGVSGIDVVLNQVGGADVVLGPLERVVVFDDELFQRFTLDRVFVVAF